MTYADCKLLQLIHRLRKMEAMKTSGERLRWLIDFSRRDLGGDLRTMKKSEWSRLKDQIIEFVAGPDEEFKTELTDEMAPDQILTEEMAVSFHTKARSRLDLLFGGELSTDLNTPGAVLSRLGGQLFVELNPAQRNTSLLLKSRFEDLFSSRLSLLIKATRPRIRVCPECKQIFYGAGKKIYCSKTCINRVSRRKWLANPENREKEAEWAHKRYKRRVRAQTSRKVDVLRRARPKK